MPTYDVPANVLSSFVDGSTAPIVDAASGMAYTPTYSGGSVTDAGSTPGQLIGFEGAPVGHATQGSTASFYNPAGTFTNTIDAYSNPNLGIIEYVPLMIAAMAGGAALGAISGGAGASASAGAGAGAGYVPFEGGFVGTEAISGAAGTGLSAGAGAAGYVPFEEGFVGTGAIS
ncbi:MAG: hypothetical protein JWQ72_2647, partial [Polaromonas sp.]|nr:hypothetical protein [Polaromonas sp.]